MTSEDKILTLEKLVNTLLSRVSQLEFNNDRLTQENMVLRQENLDLRSRLNKTSQNSHKPPSSAGYSQKPAGLHPAIPKVMGKLQGGQLGHEGKTLEMVSNPDILIEHHAPFCGTCHHALNSSDVVKTASRHQVFDLPPQQLLVTEHRLGVSKCGCGCLTKAVLPAGISACPVQYGSGLKALSVYLNTDLKIPFDKISSLFGNLYGYHFNESTAVSSNQIAYERLEGIENHIKEQLLAAHVLHSDETGIRCQGSLNWLHVASNPIYTYLFVHQKRGKLAIESEQSILPQFQNYLMHDCWASYWNLPNAKHLLCNAHLIRELQALIEQGKSWTKTMQAFLLDLYGKTKKNNTIIDQKLIPSITAQFHRICQEGVQEEPSPPPNPHKRGRIAKSKGLNLLERLKNNQDAILAFAFFEEIPFTNNQAERDLRMVKTKMKVATCFRTILGANHYARIQGFVSTMRKHNRNPFHELINVFQFKFQWA
jgi:transposase